jgi:hypothetical protein
MDSMKRLEAKRQFSAVAQMVGFGLRRSKMLYLQCELTDTLSAICTILCAKLRSSTIAFEPSLVRDSVGARPRHATLRIAAAGAIATLVGSIVLARAVGDKRLSDTLLEAGRQALHHQAAGASAGACPAGSI